jgi:hypothetical protein
MTKLDVSINGQDYFGSLDMQFVEKLVVHKIAPLSGPIGGHTKVAIYSSGINSSVPVSSGVFVKFGTIDALDVDKSGVSEVSFYQDEYHKELSLNSHLLKHAEENDWPVEEG